MEDSFQVIPPTPSSPASPVQEELSKRKSHHCVAFCFFKGAKVQIAFAGVSLMSATLSFFKAVTVFTFLPAHPRKDLLGHIFLS